MRLYLFELEKLIRKPFYLTAAAGSFLFIQMDAAVPDSTITQKQAELNRLYDSFSAKYGLINDRANRLAYACLLYTSRCV